MVIDRKALLHLSELQEKSQRLIKEKCRALSEDPFPGKGGDKELLHLEFKLYRLLLPRGSASGRRRSQAGLRRHGCLLA